jgi:hypothetical protein
MVKFDLRIHHQPINVPTAGEQAFLVDYPQGERAITHHAGPVRIGGWFARYRLLFSNKAVYVFYHKHIATAKSDAKVVVVYSPATQDVVGLIPAEHRSLCAWTHVLGLGVSIY